MPQAQKSRGRTFSAKIPQAFGIYMAIYIATF
jgi:hypothetical protein